MVDFLFQNKKQQEKDLLETTKKIKTRKSLVASPKSPSTRPKTKKKTPRLLQRKTMAKSPIKRAQSKQPRELKKKVTAKSPIKKPLSKEPMVHLKQTGILPTKTQPKRKPPMTLQTKEKEKSPSAAEKLDMTQQEQSPKIQAKAIAAKDHVSPLPHRQGLTVQVQIQSPKKTY